MNCPRCSLELAEISYEKVAIDRCGKCCGVWLDEGELASVVDTEEEKFPPELVRDVISHAFSGLSTVVATGASVAKCPKCEKAMGLLNYGYNSGIIIDRCLEGHGVWLDAGELEKIQAYREEWKREAPEHRENWIKLIRDVKAKTEGAEARAEVANRMGDSTFLFRQFFKIFISE